MNKKYLFLLIVVITFFLAFTHIQKVNAATVTVTLTPSTIANADNTTSKIVSFVPSTVLANNHKVYVYYPSSYTDSSLVAGDITVTKTGDANFTSASVSVDTTNDVLTLTLVAAGNLDTTNAFTITFAASKLVTSSTGGVNYSFGIATSNLSGGGDVGASLQYVGNLNLLDVNAIVPPSIAFAIRNTSDSAEQATNGTTKVCDLGVLNISSVATCSYRLKVTTNASSGYTLSYNSDARLTNGSYNFTDASIGGSGSTIVAGTETYGVVLTPGSISSGGSVTRNSTKFGSNAANAYRITEASGPYTVLTASSYNAPSGTDTTNTTLMEHKAAISGSTNTGNYTHRITYTVTANF